jgi:uncharacterized delta-60 repeat protein
MKRVSLTIFSIVFIVLFVISIFLVISHVRNGRLTSTTPAEGAGGAAEPASWAKAYGKSFAEKATSIQQTSDGGYVVAGLTESFGAGEKDAWILKLNAGGTVEWQKTYGGAGPDEIYSIRQTSDGGYIASGSMSPIGAGESAEGIWVIRLASDGAILWQKLYGNARPGRADSIQQTADGGYVVAGGVDLGGERSAALVLKLASDGSTAWQSTYSGQQPEEAYSIVQTTDGGYIVGGYAMPSYKPYATTGYDFWAMKLYPDGSLAWQKAYDAGMDQLSSIQQTSDGGFIVAGDTIGSVSYDSGICDVWILKLNPDGSVAWHGTYGGPDRNHQDHAACIRQTSDGGFIVAGQTESFGAGKNDVWILKLNPDGAIVWQKTYGGKGSDEAACIRQASDGGFIVAGCTKSFGDGINTDVWILKLNADGSMGFNPSSGAITVDTDIAPRNMDKTVDIHVIDITVGVSGAAPQDTAVTPQDTDARIEQQAP